MRVCISCAGFTAGGNRGLNVRRNRVYVDCTFGGGRHSRELLKHLREDGRLLFLIRMRMRSATMPDDKADCFYSAQFQASAALSAFEQSRAGGWYYG